MIRLPTREAPLTHDYRAGEPRSRPAHEDRADRFLAATAKVLELIPVTAHGRLAGSREFAVLANRRRRAS